METSCIVCKVRGIEVNGRQINIANFHPGYTRHQDVSADEAILFLVDQAPARPTELLDILMGRFIPPFKESDIKKAFGRLLHDRTVLFTNDRYIKRNDENE